MLRHAASLRRAWALRHWMRADSPCGPSDHSISFPSMPCSWIHGLRAGDRFTPFVHASPGPSCPARRYQHSCLAPGLNCLPVTTVRKPSIRLRPTRTATGSETPATTARVSPTRDQIDADVNGTGDACEACKPQPEVGCHRPTVQLKNSNGPCWEAAYSAPGLKNTAGPPASFFDQDD